MYMLEGGGGGRRREEEEEMRGISPTDPPCHSPFVSPSASDITSPALHCTAQKKLEKKNIVRGRGFLKVIY